MLKEKLDSEAMVKGGLLKKEKLDSEAVLKGCTTGARRNFYPKLLYPVWSPCHEFAILSVLFRVIQFHGCFFVCMFC